MEFVIDTNCLISALIRSSKSREIICSYRIVLYAPEHIITETLNNKKDILEKSGIDEQDLGRLINILLSNINIIPESEFEHFKKQALSLVKHPEDAPFIALCLSRNLPLWSDDKDLKNQKIIKVYNTKELIGIL